MQEPGRLQSMESKRVGHNSATSPSHQYSFSSAWLDLFTNQCPHVLPLVYLFIVCFTNTDIFPKHTEVKSLSHVQLFVTSWTVAYQAPASMGFSGQEYWSGVPSPSLGDLSDPGINPGSPALTGRFFIPESPGIRHNARKGPHGCCT